MKKLFFGLFLFTIAVTAHASDSDIINNGANSQNTVVVEDNKSTKANQGSTTTITNTINANASTGNNSVSGNTNGSATIITGNASVTIDVQNKGNTNSATVSCCTTPTPTSKPTNSPKPQPTPTSPPQTPSSHSDPQSSNTSSSSNSSDPDSSEGGIGGGDVLALSSTSSSDWITVVSNIGGVICLSIGTALISKRKKGTK